MHKLTQLRPPRNMHISIQQIAFIKYLLRNIIVFQTVLRYYMNEYF